MSGSYDHLEMELRDDGILVVTFNRPEKLNAFTQRTVAELEDALHAAEANDAVKALILTGRGRGWCAGADLGGGGYGADRPARTSRLDFHRTRYGVTHAIFASPKPVVAAVNGYVLGMGLGICLACDVRIASSQAIFSTMFIKRGLASDYGGAFLLSRMVGRAQALAMLYSGEQIDAETALQRGMVSRVVAPERLLDEAVAWLQPVVNGPLLAIETAKRMVNFHWAEELEAYLQVEGLLQSSLSGTEDLAEGMRAFQEKRSPRFSGR